ncbi:MAG: HEAT repeat domain-containing protein, partial [Planctomycetes bacterium]|nr:HEAT repeat domain-containing protein [Planctomycetota bacterium]
MVPAALCPVCLAAAILQAPSGEALLALRAMRLPEGLRAELFAAEPHVTNPVAFWVDERGRVLVAETFRIEAGVTDTREHMGWLDDDLAARTVADRVAMYSKHLGDVSRSFTAEHDRVRLVEDTDGDRAADRATVFAGGFHAVEDGIGAGVISRGGDVWYACIPHLWLLRDKDGDGKAEKRTAIHSGYGVHVGYYGHDLHGLRFGPDGRLYFSIGDRGLNVETGGRRLVHLDAGAVLRCEPDGSGLEVFATGLRNPQELAFNEVGDLFTGDNNSDGGDEARWVHAVEGGDSGWRIGYQFIDGPVSRGPWNREKLWRPRPEGGAAYIVPPLANLAAGPSGLCFYPGTGLPERCGGRFFLADFRGANATSGVWSFALEPRGASYEVVDLERWVWGVLATDADFGPDGALYISDWVHGWRGTGKGRIYRVFDPALAKDPLVLGTRRLLEEGMDRRSIEELARLLEHPDQRVRQEAQFALVARGEAALPALSGAARRGPRLARLHAVWGLGQVARRAVSAEVRGAAAEAIVGSLRSDDAEARAQAAKTLAEAPTPDALERLLPLLTDPSPRARFFAAMAVGKLGRTEAVPAVLRLLEEDAGRDAFLRHAGVMALAGATGASALLPHAGHPSRSVRLGVLLALRRLESPEAA